MDKTEKIANQLQIAVQALTSFPKTDFKAL
jgi:hypothetical protein